MKHSLLSAPMKLVWLVLGLALLALGLLGLIFPLIPGILFLAAAVFVLSKASRRVQAWSRNSPTYMGMERRFALMGGVGWLDRVRLGALMTLEATVRGLESVSTWVTRQLRR